TNLAMFLGYQVPAERAGEEPAFRSASNRELASPHTLVVNAHGERFADESYFQAMLSAIRHFDVWRHQPANLPCYLVFDQEYADRYSFAGAPAGSAIPVWVPRAGTVGDLAAALELDPARLEAAGNTAACVDYGAGYQAGLSLARGLTFSYLAVAHLLGAAS